jgi:hypothetical protein
MAGYDCILMLVATLSKTGSAPTGKWVELLENCIDDRSILSID